MSRNMDEEDSMLFSLLFTWWWWILKWEGKKSWIFDELTCNQCCQNMCGNLVFIMKFFSELSWHDFISGLLIEYEIITDSLLGNMTWQNYNMIDTKCKNIIILSDFLRVANMHQKKEEIKETTSNLFFLFGCFAFLYCLHD